MSMTGERLKELKTKESYDILWLQYSGKAPKEKYHFDHMQEVIPDKIVRGKQGLELGCGCGWDLQIMAIRNPSVMIIGMDMSDGVYTAKEVTGDLKNAEVIKGSASAIPFGNESFDFVYSFGVLHHMPQPYKGLAEICRVLKKDSPVFLYLYEDHAENPVKHAFIIIVSKIRKITVTLPPRLLYVAAYIFSPSVFLFFTIPARIFGNFKRTRFLYEKMPFNFGTGFFSLAGDLYDRFSAPIEHRYSRQEAYNFLGQNCFVNIRISRLKDTAGWVIWGYKK